MNTAKESMLSRGKKAWSDEQLLMVHYMREKAHTYREISERLGNMTRQAVHFSYMTYKRSGRLGELLKRV